jgi:hypothetical protein
MHKTETHSRTRRRKLTRLGSMAALSITLGLSTLAGCSTSEPIHQASASQQIVAHFALSECQQIGGNLYKCPAVDKPICNPDYSGEVECIRVGRKGGVYVQGSPLE